MITYPEVERKNVRFIAFNLFIFFTATYLLTYSGSAIVDVSQLRIEVAKSLVEGFDMAVPIGMGLEGVDGRDYSWFGPGSVLMVLPFYIIGKFAGIPPENIFDIVILLVGVSTVVMVFLLLPLFFTASAPWPGTIQRTPATMASRHSLSSCPSILCTATQWESRSHILSFRPCLSGLLS